MNTEEILFKIIYNHFSDSNMNSNNWNEVIKNSDFNSPLHLLNTTKYYVSYFSHTKSLNLSFIVYYGKQPFGVMPLMAHKNEDNSWILSSNGSEIIEPIFNKKIAKKIKKKIEIKILNLIFHLSRELKIKKCQFTNVEFFNSSKWQIKLMEEAEEIFTSQHSMVDLSLSNEKIRSKLRERYKSLVNKGFRDWKIQVHEKASKELFKKIRSFHTKIAKRSTRPEETWNIQNESVNKNEALLITASNKDNKLVGFGLFMYSKSISKYAVGAYNRDLFDKPIGHTIQMKAIEIFKDKGCLWHDIGLKQLKSDKKKPSSKELSISNFKEGFATHILPRLHFVINVDNCKL